MNEKRIELRVGVFVLLGLALVAALMLYFAKGLTLFQPTYTLYLETSNVGGLKTMAPVLMSGVQVGNVESIELSPDGKSASVALKIRERYKVYPDAEFAIDALGFLGDQYISIRPSENKGQPLQDGAKRVAKEPFNMQEVARASLGFVHRLDQTAEEVTEAIRRIDRMILNEQTLTNFADSVATFRQVSQRSLDTVNSVEDLFKTNSLPIHQSLSNLVAFSEQLNELADALNETIITNRSTIGSAVSNIEEASRTVNRLLSDVESGKGLAGGLMKDEEIMNNLSLLASNLAVTSSNLNTRGLWGILWRQKQPAETPARPPRFHSPRETP